MNKDEFWADYFNNNSINWIDEAYQKGDYTYPVGAQRLKVLQKILSKYDLNGKKCLDIGCGGGDISFYLATQGAIVTGIDMTNNMIDISEKRKLGFSLDIQRRLSFYQADFGSLPRLFEGESFDFVVAFGLIGYLDSDDLFFESISNYTHLNTIVILSCRNRLFNITSVSDNTVNEIDSGSAKELILEIDSYYKEGLKKENLSSFQDNLLEAAKFVKNNCNNIDSMEYEYTKVLPGTGENQPRSTSPKTMNLIADRSGFTNISMHGVHPHLLLPRMNRMLPPQMFNILSDALCVFEDEPISLVFSSVFIGEYIKQF